jgi:hypothetical protein
MRALSLTRLVVAVLLLTGCVPSELVDVGGRGNPYADTSIVPTRDPKTLKYGYVEGGKWVIPPEFDAACAFLDKPFAKHDGEAIVQIGYDSYFIDKSGKILSKVPFPYHPDTD